MKEATRRQLAAVNRRFYRRFATEFSTTRSRPWPGWRRVVGHLAEPRGRPPAVLDVGCGNGRFGACLASLRAEPYRYLGVDRSTELLRFAAKRLEEAGVRAELRQVDLLESDLTSLVAGQLFDLVAIFGVLHHLPGAAARRDLMRELGALLASSGVLAASIWQPERDAGFERRVVPWRDYNARLVQRDLEPIEAGDLEPGDHLLTWSGDVEDPRYCHFPDEAEVESWIEAMSPGLCDRFEADGPSGRDNQYLVFRR
ncbi:MAG: class I SAM-dependent methyltransferase [bacterium]|nr:class I SAM-dependent methyltransferase [bacterium]